MLGQFWRFISAIPNTFPFKARNAADNADIDVFQINGADRMEMMRTVDMGLFGIINLAGTTSIFGAINAGQTRVNRVIFVTKNGDDGNADGSIALPFLTIQAAMNFIADASETKRYGIFVGPGDYVETGLTLKPNVFIIGQDQNIVSIDNDVDIVLDASWSAVGDNRAGFIGCTIFPVVDLDFQGVSAPESTFDFRNCNVQNDIDYTNFVSNDNVVNVINSELEGILAVTGSILLVRNSIVATINVFSEAAKNTSLTLLGSVVTTMNVTGAAGETILLALLGDRVSNFTSNASTATTVVAGSHVLPSGATLGAGNVFAAVSQATRTSYTPSLASNYISAITLVSTALNELASRAPIQTGIATLVAGTVTVAAAKVAAGDVIVIGRNTPGGILGNLSAPSASIVANTSFVINSDSAVETSTVNYAIFRDV